MSRRSREVNIFHFSFLDILFNTIGAITFIFMIFAVMTNDLVEEKNVARIELNEQLDKIENSKKKVEELKEQSESMEKELSEIQDEIKKSKDALNKAKTDIRKQKIELNKKDKTISQLKKAVTSMEKGTGIDSDIDPAMMSEWGEAGGAQATKITGKMMGENIESQIVTGQGEEFSISGVKLSDSDKLKKWMQYYDDKNQNIQFLSNPGDTTAMENFQNLFNNFSSSKGIGLKNSRDLKFPGNISPDTNSINIDSTGDNLKDSTYYDLDKDGRADKLEKDIDNDGLVDEVYFHFDTQNRRWKTKLVDINSDGAFDTAFQDTNMDNDFYEIKMLDFDPKTGKARVKFEDNNSDGIFDIKYVDTDMSDDDWEEAYTNIDSNTKKWTKISMDSNNDAVPDVLLEDTDTKNETFEIKQVDNDYDGVFDSKWMDLEPEDADWEAEYKGQDENTGNWKEVFFDTKGDGKWDVHGINSNTGTENFDILMKDDDGDERFEVRMEDSNGDGVFEKKFEDIDGDGVFEKEFELNKDSEEYTEINKKDT